LQTLAPPRSLLEVAARSTGSKESKAALQRQAEAADRLASSAYTWDVFISHTGKEADKTFAMQLWRMLAQPGIGLRVFLDEPRLRVAEEAGPQMLAAMRSSRVGLVLLSQEFFERDATKEELTVLLERKDLQRLYLLPVFLRLTVEECTEAAFPGAHCATFLNIATDG
jgi:hypothetical protein